MQSVLSVVEPEPSAAPTEKLTYPAVTANPTQQGPRGIRFDFNQGARVVLPPKGETEPPWQVRLHDLDTGSLLFENENHGAAVMSAKRFYVRFRVEVREAGELVFEHDYDACARDVLILFPVGTLGDILAWFPYAEAFADKHACNLTCAMSEKIIPLLCDAYPYIRFVTHEAVNELKLAETAYATYHIGLFFDDAEQEWQPCDFKQVGLGKTAAYILGVPPTEASPLILVDGERPIAERYACIAVQATSGAKLWNNPDGWREVVAHLKARGLRVICIDQKPVSGFGLLHAHIPHGAEDETGDRPLTERARWLKHCEVFVGLSSGLAWLAWSVGASVVMISGFSHPTNEFATPYRVINWHTCNSCWNDQSVRFDHKDFLWCPRHAGTERHFECTRLITGAHVNAMVDRALGLS